MQMDGAICTETLNGGNTLSRYPCDRHLAGTRSGSINVTGMSAAEPECGTRILSQSCGADYGVPRAAVCPDRPLSFAGDG
jgi:hypothetical protein